MRSARPGLGDSGAASAPLLGVLGGMGPMATSHFYRLLVERTTARVDQDHLPVAIWADPTVPDRTAALTAGGPSPIPRLLDGLRWLRAAGADCIAIPCNTAHAFREQLIGLADVEILDMVRSALQAAVVEVPRARRVGIIATGGTRAAGVYERAAQPLGLEIVHVPERIQRGHVDPAIRAVKRGRDWEGARGDVAAAAHQLEGLGADVVIGACTEIPLVAEDAARVLPFIDSTGCLADAALRRLRPLDC